ncbi:MAG: hypothetical protein OIF32_06540 [Campylobacterales bacterium]|nr:hypothetical protein [Campylobacterales bacterium]
MDLIEDIYEHQEIDKKTIPRKLTIDTQKAIIQTPKYCGVKKYISDLILQEKKKFLYIDLQDLRTKDLATKDLNHFIQEEKIQLIVVENYKATLEDIVCETVYLLTEENIKIDGFKNYSLLPLDFEEFISLHKKIENIEELFDEYFKHGSLPEMIHLKDQERVIRAREFIYLLFPLQTKQEIFKFIVLKTGFAFSLFQAFNLIKQEIKISKDIFYKTVEELENKKYIFSVSKFESPKAPKKYYPYDFVFKQALTFKKDLGKNFEHMVFLELIKGGFEVYYMDFIDFFIPSENRAVLTLPFLNYEQLLVKSTAVLSVKTVETIEIVTMGYEYTGEVHGAFVTAKPFWTWALEK